MERRPALHKSFSHADDRFFQTSNLYLAAVLFTRGISLANVDRSDLAHCRFVFRDSFELRHLVKKFNTREAILVDAHRFISGLKLLRRRMAGKPS